MRTENTAVSIALSFLTTRLTHDGDLRQPAGAVACRAADCKLRLLSDGNHLLRVRHRVHDAERIVLAGASLAKRRQRIGDRQLGCWHAPTTTQPATYSRFSPGDWIGFGLLS